MSSLEPSNPTIVHPEKCNIAEVQDEDFRIAIMNRSTDCKKNMNKSINKGCENTVKLNSKNCSRHKTRNIMNK